MLENPSQLPGEMDTQAELSEKMRRLLGLSNDAVENGAPAESLFKNDEEKQQLIERMQRLESALSDGDTQMVEQAITEFSTWYQNAQVKVGQRMRSMVGYFGGLLPDRLSAQARLFDAVDADVKNLNHYLNLSKE
ncbi:hypothetical protein KA082_00020 [Candidatus Woesebacteria bacterium]|nr:hypothetical protein [Candidatus Woesebacteria bacterium]